MPARFGKRRKPQAVKRDKERALELAIAGHTRVAIARAMDVAPDTVSSWLNTPAAAARIDRAMDYSRSSAVRALKALAEKAVERLADALDSPNERIALDAARTVLDRVGIVAGVQVEHSGALTVGALSAEEMHAAARGIIEREAERRLLAGDAPSGSLEGDSDEGGDDDEFEPPIDEGRVIDVEAEPADDDESKG